MDPESMGQKTLIITQILISLILVKYSDKRTKNVTKKKWDYGVRKPEQRKTFALRSLAITGNHRVCVLGN